MKTVLSNLHLKEHAQGMAEFALALPFLLMLVFGVIEAGHLLFVYSATNTASREAVRYGSAAGDIGGYVTHYEDCDGIRSSAKRMGSLAGIQDADISITYDQGPGTAAIASCNPTFSIDDPDVGQVSLGDRVVVQVEADYQPIVPLVNFPPFKISTVARRVIVKDVAIEGTPKPSTTPQVIIRRLDKPPEIEETSESEGVGMVVLVAELNVATSQEVTVPFSVTGTATNGVDYTITSSPVVIPPGLPTARIEINIIDDTLDEYDETIVVTMGEPTNADKAEPFQHTLTIIDNDDPPSVFFSPAGQSKQEEAGSMTVLAQLSAISAKNITVPFGVSGTAAQGDDFTVTAGPLSFPAGTDAATLLITIIDDNVDEEDETVILTLLDPPMDPIDGQPNVVLGTPNPHVATIQDDLDTAVLSFTWESQEVAETASSMPIQVQLSNPSSRDVTVRFHVDGGSTATDGGADDDYDLQASPILIPKGQTTANIDFTPKADGLVEDPESVILVLDPPTNAELGSPSTHTTWITDTPLELPTVFFANAQSSGGEDVGKLNVVVQLSHAWVQEVRVSVSIGGTATQGADYSISSTQVVIPAGGKSFDITINVTDDSVDEFNETVVLTLGNPTHAAKGSPDQHIATILDNDDEPTVYFQMASQSADETDGQMLVAVRLSAPTGKPVTVPFNLTGTASQGPQADYTISSSPLTIPAGSTSASIVITINNDDIVGEDDETIIISMATPTNAIKGSPDVHTAKIIDDDQVTCPSLGTFTFNDFKLSLPVSNIGAGAEPATITSIIVNWNYVPSQKLSKASFAVTQIWTGSDNNSPTYMPTEGSWTGASSDRLLNAGSTKSLQFEFDKTLATPYSSYIVTVGFDNGCVVSRSGGSN